MSTKTVGRITQAGIPQPVYRFADDASPVMVNRSSTFGGGAHTAPAAAAGFNIDTQDTQANILLRTGDPAGFIAFATDTFNYLVCDGDDNWTITLNIYL